MEDTVANKWLIMFNFFSKADAPTGYATFMDCWWDTARYIQGLECFGISQLHRNLDPKGLYKFVNYAGFDSDDFPGFHPPAGEWLDIIKKNKAGNCIKSFPGGYREIGTADDNQWAPILAQSDDSVFLISTFKVEDETNSGREDFKHNWMIYSGAQFITDNAPKSIKIANIGIYRRFTKKKDFAYILRAELIDVGSDLTEAWGLVEKLRARSLPKLFTETNTSLYMVMPETIILNKKKFPTNK